MKRRLITFTVLGFVVYFLLTSPVEAAGLIRGTVEMAGNLLSGAAESLSTFLRALV
jgi:hypothetical protein